MRERKRGLLCDTRRRPSLSRCRRRAGRPRRRADAQQATGRGDGPAVMAAATGVSLRSAYDFQPRPAKPGQPPRAVESVGYPYLAASDYARRYE
jgi:hypothetical protein